MRQLLPFTAFLFLSICSNPANCQVLADADLFEQQQTAASFLPAHHGSIIIPMSMAGYGVLALNRQELRNLNEQIKQQVTPSDLSKKIHADDYLQYSPAALMFALKAAGIRGKSKMGRSIALMAISNITVCGIVTPIKKISRELRPDGSGYSSFPSGHTATAFANAELMRMEFRETSPWYGVAGYAMAVTTGYLRMYNNKHWFSDVVSGACVGIAATRFSYWLTEKLKSKSRFTNQNPTGF